MKKFFLISCFSLIFYMPIAYTQEESISLQEGRDYLVICKDGGAGAYEAFPDVCRIPDGRLLCVFL